MNNFGCSCRNNCLLLSVAASIILGIIAAFLTITAVITVTPAFLWVLFGIAVGYQAIAILTSGFLTGRGFHNCLCPALSVFSAGILGTVLTSVILLGIEFAATSIVGAIITGTLILFFSLLITSAICLIKCITNCHTSEV